MNNKVNFLRGTATEYESSIKDNDTFYYTTDTKKLYLGETEITSIEIDDTSTTATDKTWSAKKIGEHTGNADIHVTAEDKAKWNAVNYSNPNLLINPDFRINQRGMANYSSEYTVDRWKTGGAKLTVNDGFISLENTTAKATAAIYQIVENPAALNGKTVVLSFDCDLKTEGAWISVQAVTNGSWNPSAPVQLTDTGRNVKSTVITLPENLTDLRLALVIHSTDSAPFAMVDIYGSKLELGSIATPFVPPDPATELAKCQRYLQKINPYSEYRTVYVQPNYVDFSIPTPTTMRAGAISIIGTPEVMPFPIASSVSGFTFAVQIYGQNQLVIRATKSSHGLSDAVLHVPQGASILLSSEL